MIRQTTAHVDLEALAGNLRSIQHWLQEQRPAAPPEVIAESRDRLGLTLPVWEQYLMYVRGLLTGDFGISLVGRQPVIDIVLNGAVATITASRISARTERRMRIFARDRYLNVDFASRKLSVVRSDPAAGAAGFKSEEFAWDDHDSLAGEHAAFAASILDGAPVLVDAAAG